MSIVTISKVNEVYIKVYSDYAIENEIKDFFTFKAPGYQFSPKYKARLWDGNISLYDIKKKTLPIGLYKYLKSYCDENKIDITFKECSRFTSHNIQNDISLEEISEFVNDLNLYNGTKPITARDYQITAIHKAITDKRVTLESPTACLDPEEEIEIYLSNEHYDLLKKSNII